MSDPNVELTPEERATIARMPRATPPPAGLEEATVAALAARGLLRAPGARRGRMALRWGLTAAAALALFAGGYLAGREERPGTTPQLPRFVLLLYEGPEYRHSPAGREAERVGEYSEWAAQRGARGELEGGEKLSDEAEIVIGPDGVERTVPPAGRDRLAGFFMIRAKDARAALQIARTCPHVHYGGSIVVREIEPT